jgi:hypothetical protein
MNRVTQAPPVPAENFAGVRMAARFVGCAKRHIVCQRVRVPPVVRLFTQSDSGSCRLHATSGPTSLSHSKFHASVERP